MYNDLAKLAPTIGMIGGGLLGTATDVIDGPLGTIGGATAGGDIGQMVQDWMTHTPVTGGQMLKQSAIGAGSSLVGEGLGSLFDAGGDAAANAIDNAAKSQAEANEAERVGQEFASIKPEYANVGKALDTMKSLGIPNASAQDMANVGPIYTGSNPETGTGIMNFVKNDALARAGGTVDLSDTMDGLHADLATPENQFQLGSEDPVSSSKGQLPKAPNNVATKIVQQVRNMLPGDTIDSSGQLATQLAPEDAQDLLRSIGKQMSATTPQVNAQGLVDPAAQAENSVWRNLYYSVKDSLYNRPEVDAAVANTTVTPELEAAIDDAISSRGITDPQVAANIKADLINKINNGQTMQDWLDSESPMVNVSKVGETATKDMANNPQLARNVKLNTPKAAESTIGKVLNSKIAKAAEMGSAVMGISDPNQSPWAKAAELGVGGAGLLDAAPELVPKMASMLSRLSAPAIEGAAGIATMPQPTQQTEPIRQGGTNVNPYATLPGSAPSALALLAASGMAGLLDPYTASAYAPLAEAAMPQIQKAQTAESELQQLESMLSQAGGAQGGLMGLLQQLRAQVSGGPVRTYQQNLQALQPILSQLGINSPLPSVTSTPQAARLGFQQAQAGLNSIL